MIKFNTNLIKKHFTDYLINNRENLFDKLAFCYFPNPKKQTLDEEDLETISNIADELNCENDALKIANIIYNEFSNIKKWSRASKEKNTWNNCFNYIDVCGENNVDLIKLLKPTDIIIIRTFSPKNEQLGDNYRLEFITLADDSDFIYWTIIVD